MHPVDCELASRKSLEKPSPVGEPAHDPGRHQVLLLIGVIAMLPFLALEAIGFVTLARTLPWAAILGGGVLTYFLLLNGPVATPKYRLPMEPVLIVLAAIPLAWLVERHRRIPAAT